MPADQTTANWNDRSTQWVKAAPEGTSKNDAPNQTLIAFAGIRQGDHVLDMASGTGEPAISIALLVGPEGSVTATDATAAMLEAAEKRAANLGLKNISFLHCPMEEIDFEENRFDAATCRFGMMHARDPLAGLRRTHHALKPGGRAAFMVHGAAELNNLWSTVHTVLAEYFGHDNAASFARHYKYSLEGEPSAVFTEAGFTDVEETLTVTEMRYPAGEAFWRGPLTRGFSEDVAALDAAGSAELERILTDAFAVFLDGEGYVLQSSNRTTRGTK